MTQTHSSNGDPEAPVPISQLPNNHENNTQNIKPTQESERNIDVGGFLLTEQAHLPTSELLKTPIEEDEDLVKVAAGIVSKLGKVGTEGDAFANLFWEHGKLVDEC